MILFYDVAVFNSIFYCYDSFYVIYLSSIKEGIYEKKFIFYHFLSISNILYLNLISKLMKNLYVPDIYFVKDGKIIKTGDKKNKDYCQKI